ncbi:pyridoxal phosphate-dependent transferase [Catenaria anguillulae PL171]|uniref:Pyridoxal phosphate-dependent transferase n=1 Tax=Catenaria anguillulae PL171 TaxID=765915 RepID=A0A1Y2I235_9FUNG|nr:pyridoxal phosphate-dependent transferase [Catenaria anguillulae PL171]
MEQVYRFLGTFNGAPIRSLGQSSPTQQRELARDAVRTGCNAPKDEYAVIFTGSGSTSAIHHVVSSLRLLESAHWPVDNPPVVFLSILEHHSNLLPWRESVAKVVLIPMDAQGHGPDLAHLSTQLQAHQHAPLLVGAFSAGSNLTGVPLNVQAMARLLHAHSALALFDYAGVGPYVPIDMLSTGADAVFISPHKFIGGPGTPGVLVIRRSLLASSSVPARPGGGSVTWVTKETTEYIQDHLEEREEAVDPTVIAAKEFATARNVLAELRKVPNVRVLGDVQSPRVPVFTFVVESPLVNKVTGKRLLVHHDFVSTVLNDLFGIQTRAGCMCAALYGQYLLGSKRSSYYKVPGYVRLSFNYFTTAAEIAYVLRAIDFVASHAHLLSVPRPAVGHTEWTNRALKVLVGRSLNASAFADAYRLARPDNVQRACEAVRDEAEREWEGVVGQSEVRQRVREYVVPADVCRAVLGY